MHVCVMLDVAGYCRNFAPGETGSHWRALSEEMQGLTLK